MWYTNEIIQHSIATMNVPETNSTFIKIEESKVNHLPLLNALKNMPFSYSYLTLNLLILITKPFGKYVYEFINIIII